MTTLFNLVIAEYRTKKAAEKYAARVVQKTIVRKATQSVYDPISRAAVFQVCLVEA